MSDESAQKASSEKRSKGRVIALVTLVLLLGIVGGAFGVGILKLPKCTPAIQQEVDWPPETFGVYEERSANELRVLDPGGFSPPGTIAVCDVEDGSAAGAVATVPPNPRFLVYLEDQADYEYTFLNQVDVPATGTCVRVSRNNAVEGVQVTVDDDDPAKVWIDVPELDPDDTYMLSFGSDRPSGVIVRVGGGQE